MTGYVDFEKRQERLPTFAERASREELERLGVADVYVAPDDAPREFWQALLQAVHSGVLAEKMFEYDYGESWWNEFRWQNGWPEKSRGELASAFSWLILDGGMSFL